MQEDKMEQFHRKIVFSWETVFNLPDWEIFTWKYNTKPKQ